MMIGLMPRRLLGRFATAAAFATAVAAGPTPVAFAQQGGPVGVAAAADLARWIDELGDDEYAVRELAQRNLQQNAQAALPLVEQRLKTDGVGPESQLRLVRLLSAWSSDLSTPEGQAALGALERIARDGGMLVAVRASNTVADLTVRQSAVAAERLQSLGAFLGFATVQIMTSQSLTPQYLMRVDDSFRGGGEDLRAVRWLFDVQMVKLAGDSIDLDVLRAVAAMPNLRVLQLRNVALGIRELEAICEVDDLDTVELLYCRISPEALGMLDLLPVSGHLRLFGTDLSIAEVDRLREELQGVEIIHGKGGFLGISIQMPSTTIVGGVTPGSGAELAGIEQNDRLRSIAGTPIANFDDLRQELAKYSAGEQIEVQLERATAVVDESGRRLPVWTPMTVQVTLGQQP